MATKRESLMDHAFRQQVYLERLKAGMATRTEATLQQADRIIREALSLPFADRAVLQRALADVRSQLDREYAGWKTGVMSDTQEISVMVVDEETAYLNSLSKAAPAGVTFTAPALNQIVAAYKTRPLDVKSYQGEPLLESMLTDLSTKQRDRLTGIIQQGFFQGKTNAAIIQEIRGTKANGYRDGALRELRDNAEAIVRTGVQHAANVAREEVYRNNSDIVEGVEWVSTLDQKTSDFCKAMDGKIFPLGKGVRPPAHIRCRSRTIPVLPKEFDFLDEGATRAARDPATGKSIHVDADQTYYEWLKKQPADYQLDVLGKTKYQLFIKGGMTPTEFSRLQLDRAFRPLTIAEMKQRNPMAFKQAGLT